MAFVNGEIALIAKYMGRGEGVIDDKLGVYCFLYVFNILYYIIRNKTIKLQNPKLKT